MVVPLFDYFDMFGIYNILYTNIEFADWLEKDSYMLNMLIYHFDLRIISSKETRMNLILI